MSPLYAAVVGLLFAVSIYLLMRESFVDHIFGLIVLSHAANLFVFGAGRLVEGAPPIVVAGSVQPTADPLPQALVLTAIVIGFGVIAFATLLVVRLYSTFGTDDARVLEEVEHE